MHMGKPVSNRKGMDSKDTTQERVWVCKGVTRGGVLSLHGYLKPWRAPVGAQPGYDLQDCTRPNVQDEGECHVSSNNGNDVCMSDSTVHLLNQRASFFPQK